MSTLANAKPQLDLESINLKRIDPTTRLPGIDLRTITPDLMRSSEKHLFGKKAADHASIDAKFEAKLAQIEALQNTPEDKQKLAEIFKKELESGIKYIDKTKFRDYEISAAKAVIKSDKIGLDQKTQAELGYLLERREEVKNELICRMNISIKYLEGEEYNQDIEPEQFARLKEQAKAFATTNNYQEKYSDAAFHKRPLDPQAIGLSIDLLIIYAPSSILGAKHKASPIDPELAKIPILASPDNLAKLNEALEKDLNANSSLHPEFVEYNRNGEKKLKPLTEERLREHPELISVLHNSYQLQINDLLNASNNPENKTINQRFKDAVLDINNKGGLLTFIGALGSSFFSKSN